MDNYKHLLLPPDPPSFLRILRITLYKAFGAYCSLCLAWYLWYFRTAPIVDSYAFIATAKQRILGETPSFMDTLRDLVTTSGRFSYLADASFYLSIIGIATCITIALLLILWMWTWKRGYVLAAVYQSDSFKEKLPDLSHRV